MGGRRYGAAVVCALALSPGSALADAPRQSASLTFTTTTPGAPTGSVLSIDWTNPNDPNAKPYAVKTLIVQFAAGSALDTTVPEQCKASDAQLEALGAAACPPGSEVARGTIVTDSGGDAGPFPRFINVAATNFNNQGELIGVGDATNAPLVPGVTRTVTHSKLTGNSFSTDFPAFQTGSPPDGYNALKSLRISASAIERDGRAYGRTPPTCPAGGSWTNKLTFIYQDGVTQTVLPTSPCAGPTAQRRPLKIRVHQVPRHGCAARRLGVRTSISTAAALRPGRHRIAITATDTSGRVAHRRMSFRRC
jgi:hypothetical protein